MTARDVLLTLVWLLPASRAKNALLRLLGHNVDPSALVGPNLVIDVGAFDVGPGGVVVGYNLFRHMEAIRMAPGARIGRMNIVTAHPVYARLMHGGGSLHLGRSAKITSRHTLDCSGALSLGAFSSLAGRQSLVLTHSVDLERDCQVAHPVTVGERSFVGARCLLLGGAQLPDRSVLAAGSVLTRASSDLRSGVWAGVPATYRRAKTGLWFDRMETSTRRVFVPATGRVEEDAL